MKRYICSAATLSWIDPAAGLPEKDGVTGPDDSLTFVGVTRTKNCRFGHLLACQVTVDDGGKIVEHSILPMSGLHTRPSAFGTAPQRYAVRRDVSKFNSDEATFVQTVGCRTMAPEIVGGRAGEEIGGAVAGGVNPAAVPLGRQLGRALGRFVVDKEKVFPPIWTKLSITLTSNGLWRTEVVAHSLFPSISYYVSPGQPLSMQDQMPSLLWSKGGGYDGVPHLAEWQEKGWGRGGNPWLVEHP